MDGIPSFKGQDEDGNEITIEPLDNLPDSDPESLKSKAKEEKKIINIRLHCVL